MSEFQKNIQALAALMPELAAELAGVALPADFQAVHGTDGTPTFRREITLPDGKRHLEWLGGTSMPRASAEPLISSLDPGGGSGSGGQPNGLGLSIGTGFEWAAFVSRLAPTQAVYVYEPTVALRMALEICDLCALISSKRLVLLSGTPDRAAAALVRWLHEHPGMEPPTVLHPLPTMGEGRAEQRNALLAAGEAIVREAVTRRQEEVAALVARVSEAARRPVAETATTQTLAFTLAARYPQERPLHVVTRRAGWKSLAIDRHDTVSLALRLGHMAAALEEGPVRVVSDLFRQQLACVPAEVAVETWVAPLVGAGFWERVPAAGLAPSDRIVVHAHDHRARLVAMGIAETSIELRPLTADVCDVATFTAANGMALQHRVVLAADLLPISAEALGLMLPTHQAIHAAARELIAEEFWTVHPGSAPDLLRRAFSRAGVSSTHAEDPMLREGMLRMIRDVLLPTVPLLAAVIALLQQGLAVTLVGDWPDVPSLDAPAGAALCIVPFGTLTAHPEEPWKEAAAFLHLSPQGIPSPFLWEAVAAGVVIVAPEHATDAAAGSLATLLAPDREYLRPRAGQLLPAIKRLLGDAPLRQKLASAARDKLAAEKS